jgi:hypothetical protein
VGSLEGAEERTSRLCLMSSNYTCPCLNVHFRALHPPPSSSPPPLSHENYQPLYVGQDGISIVHTLPYFFYILFIFLPQVHPQLTLRSRQHSNAQSDSDLFLRRHTSLTCLICRLSVYRVLQLIPLDMDSTEGPVLPTEEWAEDQVLQSGSGWIEMDKQCLVSPFARHKVHLASFSAVFCSPISFFKDR